MNLFENLQEHHQVSFYGLAAEMGAPVSSPNWPMATSRGEIWTFPASPELNPRGFTVHSIWSLEPFPIHRGLLPLNFRRRWVGCPRASCKNFLKVRDGCASTWSHPVLGPGRPIEVSPSFFEGTTPQPLAWEKYMSVKGSGIGEG